jgi:P63C domain
MTDGDSRGSEKARKQASRRGGLSRAQNLPRTRRSEIAQMGAIARWSAEGTIAMAQYGAPDRPLCIGQIEIPAYVLADGRRVLAQRGLQSGVGLSEGGGKTGARKLVELMARLDKKGIDTRGLAARANSPIRFVPPHGGSMADGYEATILPDLCAVLIEAGLKGALDKRLERLAERAAVLQHGFAEVGIIALVDEVTGYQADRARDALARVLARFIAKELQPWVRTFPADWYKGIYRLRGWEWKGMSVNRTQALAHITNDLIYARLAPGVREELNRIRLERKAAGKPQAKMFQSLTVDTGHPRLKEHLAVECAFMKVTSTWEEFMGLVDQALPRFDETLNMFPPEAPQVLRLPAST